MRTLMTLVFGLVMACCAGCGGGPLLVKEAQMSDRAAVASIARDKIKIRTDQHPTALRVALVGVNSDRVASKTEHSRWDGSAVYNKIASAMGTANAVSDIVKQVSCRALDSAFDGLLPALNSVGLQPVSVSSQLDSPAYSGLLENEGGSIFCVADKARVSAMRMMGAGFASAFGEDDHLTEFQRDLIRLMDEAGVDGVLIAVLSANRLVAANSTLVLLTKQPDGSVLAVWQGDLKENLVRFEPVVEKPQGDEDEVKNVARVYHHSFVLLAAKLAADTKAAVRAAN